jgi:hypothetical protein
MRNSGRINIYMNLASYLTYIRYISTTTLSVGDQLCGEFTIVELIRLRAVLEIPERIVCENGTALSECFRAGSPSPAKQPT